MFFKKKKKNPHKYCSTNNKNLALVIGVFTCSGTTSIAKAATYLLI